VTKIIGVAKVSCPPDWGADVAQPQEKQDMTTSARISPGRAPAPSHVLQNLQSITTPPVFPRIPSLLPLNEDVFPLFETLCSHVY
jgi:hypothetical protein